jgi:hypothetical protein
MKLPYELLGVGESANLYDYTGKKVDQRAEIIVRRKNLTRVSNDIGFARKADGNYEIVISDYDISQDREKWVDKFPQVFSKNLFLKAAKKLNRKIKRTTVTEDGTIEIEL